MTQISLPMADVVESLDLLAFLDEVADETVSRLVHELGPHPVSCGLGDRDALDILSICDTASLCDIMANSSQADRTVADDKCKHVHSQTKEVSPADDKTDHTHSRKKKAGSVSSLKKGCDSVHTSFPTTNFLSARHSSVVVLQIKPSADPCFGQSVSEQDAGQKSMPKPPTRWQFSKTQRQQLDAVFQKTMYPSKWRVTELSRILQVPVRTIRVWFQNRRWRLRRSQGLSGNLKTRGSRTMLPEKDNSTPERQLSAPVCLNRQNESGSPSYQKAGSSATRFRTLKKRNPATTTTTTAATPTVSTTAPSFTPAAASSPVGVLSPSHWQYTNTGKDGDGSLMYGSPGSVSRWHLPSVYWPTDSLRLSPYSFTFPLQSCYLPVLQGSYSAVPSPYPLGQSFYSDVSMQQLGSAVGSSFNPLSQTNSDRTGNDHYLQSADYSSAKREAYYSSSRPDHTVPTIYSPSSFIKPSNYITLTNASFTDENSVQSKVKTHTSAPSAVSAYGSESSTKWGSTVYQITQNSPYQTTQNSLYQTTHHHPYQTTQHPPTFTGLPIPFGSMVQAAGSSDALSNMEFQAPEAKVTRHSSSMNLSSLPSTCPCGICQGFSSTQAWAQFLPPSQLTSPGFEPLQPSYLTDQYPTLSTLAGPQFSPLTEPGGTVRSQSALPPGAADREVQTKLLELHASRKELHTTGTELHPKKTGLYTSSDFISTGAERYTTWTGASSGWAEDPSAEKDGSARREGMHINEAQQSSSREELKATWKQLSTRRAEQHVQESEWSSAKAELHVHATRAELGSERADLQPTRAEVCMAEAAIAYNRVELNAQGAGLNFCRTELSEKERSLVLNQDGSDDSDELDVITVGLSRGVEGEVTSTSNDMV